MLVAGVLCAGNFELGGRYAILTFHLHAPVLDKFMKSSIFSSVFSLLNALIFSFLAATPTLAQDAIFRCGNEYTNNAADAKARGCKTLTGGNVTVIQGTKPATSSAVKVAAAPSSSPPGSPRVEATEQRSRDAGARAILESELKRTEARLADLQKEYNNGEPDRIGGEGRNHQKYLDRLADLKANIARSEEDIAGIKREMARLTASK